MPNGAVELDPNSATGHLNLANIFIALGKADEAGQEASRAVELDPGVPNAVLFWPRR